LAFPPTIFGLCNVLPSSIFPEITLRLELLKVSIAHEGCHACPHLLSASFPATFCASSCSASFSVPRRSCLYHSSRIVPGPRNHPTLLQVFFALRRSAGRQAAVSRSVSFVAQIGGTPPPATPSPRSFRLLWWEYAEAGSGRRTTCRQAVTGHWSLRVLLRFSCFSLHIFTYFVAPPPADYLFFFASSTRPI